MGKDRKSFAGHTVRLEDDVAKMFPSAEAVNEALRLVVRIMQQNQELASVATKIGIGYDSEK